MASVDGRPEYNLRSNSILLAFSRCFPPDAADGHGCSSCNAGLRSRLPHVHLYFTNHRQHCTRTAIQRPGNPRITLLTCSVQYSPNKLYNSSSDRRSRGRPTVSYLQPFLYSQASPDDIVFIATLMPQHDESMCLLSAGHLMLLVASGRYVRDYTIDASVDVFVVLIVAEA